MSDLNDILSQFGITSDNDEETVQQESQTEEYDENMGEGHDDIIQDPVQENVENAGESAEEGNTEGGSTLSSGAVFSNAASPQGPQEERDTEGILPPNSPTLLVDEYTSRFSGAEWYDSIRRSKVIIAGLGGIGSHLAFNVARMSPSAMVMYDDDIVDPTNMSGQLYNQLDIGCKKVNALGIKLKAYTSTTQFYCIPEKFTPESETGDIMMCGFDNMAARSNFFHAWERHLEGKSEEEKSKCLYLDGRLSLTVMQVLCMTGNDSYNMERYEKEFLFSDAEADETVCSMKQTTYLASMIGAVMTNLFTNFIANTHEPFIPYTLPFFTEYDAQYMIFKIEN